MSALRCKEIYCRNKMLGGIHAASTLVLDMNDEELTELISIEEKTIAAEKELAAKVLNRLLSSSIGPSPQPSDA